jgi:hypothetical protein
VLFIITIVLQLQQASARTTKNRSKFIIILEPELPPLGAASLYLPFEDTNINSSLVSKLRNARLLTRLYEQRTYVYQARKLQVNYSSVSEKNLQTRLKSINMQHNTNWQYPLIEKIVPLSLEKSIGTIWMNFWKDGFCFTNHNWQAEFGEQDVFALYDQVKIGKLGIAKP